MKMVGIILAGGRSSQSQLTQNYAAASLPVAGYYNAIDFSLSSMVNSGINKVAVVTQYSSRALNEHLKSSTYWGFGRKHGGLYLVSPMVTADKQTWYKGTIDALADTLDILKESHEPYAVIASGDGIYRLDYQKVLEKHIEKGAEITVVCTSLPEGESQERYGVVHRAEDDRIISFSEKADGDEKAKTISCGIYIIRRRTLIDMLEKAVAEGKTNFVEDVIIPGLAEGKTYAYKHRGYWENISTDEAYYKCNMSFLDKEIRDEFFAQEPPILTRVTDRPPTKYLDGAVVKESLIGSGCVIDGEVSSSVLFAGVTIGKGAVVRNSIVFPNCVIAEGAVIEGVIINKENDIIKMA